ncbi:MAG TPA: hypothetical protein VFJ01_02170 [Oleiagrimonas sp.]|nr:hypothetical protein [Oleiagrimonas sp.]
MYTRSLASLAALAAALLITAGAAISLAVSVGSTSVPTPTVIDGMPVTTLPAITVTASIDRSTTARRTTRSKAVTVADTSRPFARLLEGAAAQVGNSHLGMPYYSFGSALGQAGKD